MDIRSANKYPRAIGVGDLECSYRRGYQQAWARATETWIHILCRDLSLEEIITAMDAYEQRLGDWRADSPDDFIPPPPFVISEK